MARMYRETVSNFNKTHALPALNIFTISPIDADQIPNGYVKTVKVSCQISDVTKAQDRSILIYASTSPNAADVSDIITSQSTGLGGGTVWLNLKRAVKSSAAEPDRPDGEVYIHAFIPGAGPSPLDVEVNYIGEVWGRFLNMAAV